MTSAESDALSAARELLPAWVVWGRTLFVPVVVFLAQLSVGVWCAALMTRSAGPASTLHWSERARRITNCRSALQGLAVVVITVVFLPTILLQSPLEPLPRGALAVSALLAWCLASEIGGWEMRRALLGRSESLRQRVRETVTTWLIFVAGLLLGVTCAMLVGQRPGPVGIAFLAATTLAIGYLTFVGPWRLLERLGWIRALEPMPPGVTLPAGVRLAEIDLPMANALALPKSRQVLVSRRARSVLSDAGLAAVLQHEFGHLAESGAAHRLRTAAALLPLGIAWARPLYGWLGFLGLLPLVAAWIAVDRLGKQSPKLEEHADEHARSHSPEPLAYAQALESLHRDNLSPAVTAKAVTHPHLYDRLLAAGMTPDFARPQPTRAPTAWLVLLFLAVVCEMIVLDGWTRPKLVERSEPALLRALALGAAPTPHLNSLADLHEQSGDMAAAGVFRRAAQAADSQR